METKKIEFTKRVIVLLDCTETKDWYHVAPENGLESAGYTILEENTCGALTTHPRLIDLFGRVAAESDKKFCVILRTSHDAMFLATLLANSLMENRLEEYPVIPSEDIEVYDVYDAELISVLDKEGFLRECGFDSSMRVLMNDYVRLQQLNAPKGPKVEFAPEEEDPAAAGDGEDAPFSFGDAPAQKGDRTDDLQGDMEVVEDVREVLARRKNEK